MPDLDQSRELARLLADNDQLRTRLREYEISGERRPRRARVLRTVLQEMPVMFVAYGHGSTITWWNRECERVTGYSASEIEYNPNGRRLLYPNRVYRRAMFEKWNARGHEWRDWEWEITCRDGSVRVISWSDVSERVKIPGCVAWKIGVDVTDRVRARDELHRKYGLINTILENLDEAVFFKDLDREYVALNSAAAKIFGVTREELLDQKDEAVLPPELAARLRDEDQEVLQSREPKSFDLELAAGEVRRVFSVRETPCRDEFGIIGLLGVGRDVTVERSREQQLRDSHAKLEARCAELNAQFTTMAEILPFGVIITRPADGVILYANQHLAKMVGIRHHLLFGQRTPDFFCDPRDRERMLGQLQEHGMVQGVIVPAKRGDGTICWLSVSMRKVLYDGKESILGGLVDVTKQKEYENFLLEKQNFLQRLVDWHDQDRQIISYEIHDGIVQDMTGAAMFMDSVSRDLLPPDDAHLLDEALHQLRKAIAEARVLINGLRPPALEDTGIVGALRLLTTEIGHTHDIDIEYQVDVQFNRLTPALEVAIYRITQEALNNIWKHSHSERALVSLKQEGARVTLVVRDWGVGFDPAQVRRERHGLAGIRERARLLGGQSRIESQPNQGTHVCVEFSLDSLAFMLRQ